MGLFTKKPRPTEQPQIPSVEEQLSVINDSDLESNEVEEETPQPSKPVQQKQIEPQPQQTEITEEILRQVLVELETRISNIESRLFRRGL